MLAPFCAVIQISLKCDRARKARCDEACPRVPAKFAHPRGRGTDASRHADDVGRERRGNGRPWRCPALHLGARARRPARRVVGPGASDPGYRRRPQRGRLSGHFRRTPRPSGEPRSFSAARSNGRPRASLPIARHGSSGSSSDRSGTCWRRSPVISNHLIIASPPSAPFLSAYDFAAATELARCNGEQLPSRWPAVALLVVTGLSYLSWLPLNLAMPISESQWVDASIWFPIGYPLHASSPGRSRLHRDVDGQRAPRDGAARRGLDRRVDRPPQPPRFVRGGRRA